MCNCINEIEKTLNNELKTDDVIIQNVCYKLPRCIQVLSCNCEYHKINTNGKKWKNKSIKTLAFTYCPFCGKKYEE